MTFDEAVMAYYHYRLDLIRDDFVGEPFTPTEFFEELAVDIMDDYEGLYQK